MRRIRTSMTYDRVIDSPGERNTLPSETVPDMALTPQQILQRFASGTLDPLQFTPEYSEEQEDYRGLDMVEIQEMRKELSKQVKYLKDQAEQEALKIEFEKQKLLDAPIPVSDDNPKLE